MLDKYIQEKGIHLIIQEYSYILPKDFIPTYRHSYGKIPDNFKDLSSFLFLLNYYIRVYAYPVPTVRKYLNEYAEKYDLTKEYDLFETLKEFRNVMSIYFQQKRNKIRKPYKNITKMICYYVLNSVLYERRFAEIIYDLSQPTDDELLELNIKTYRMKK